MRILFIGEQQTIDDCVQNSNLDFFIDSAYNSEDGRDLFGTHLYDAVIVDESIVGSDCLTLYKDIKNLRPESNVLCMVDARDFNHISKALDSGADDYIIKPLEKRELRTKLKVISKRLDQIPKKFKTYKFNDLNIDTRKKLILVRNKNVFLRRREYELLEFLVCNSGRIISEEEILEYIWNDYSFILSNTVASHIRRLRKKIGINHIKTYKNQGYKFIP